MKEFTLRLMMDLKATVRSIKEDPDGENGHFLNLLQTFLNEFVKHDEAVLQYYKNVLIETLFSSDYIDLGKIKELLGYSIEPGKIFLPIAEHCKDHVEPFMINLYDEDNWQNPNLYPDKSDWLRGILESQFLPPRVNALSFSFHDGYVPKIK